MLIALAILPSALVSITIGIVNDSIAVFFVVQPLTLVLPARLIMIYTFAVFFAIEEVALVFVLISIDDFSFVGSLVINPFSIVDGPT